jgi:hypothetical protein
MYYGHPMIHNPLVVLHNQSAVTILVLANIVTLPSHVFVAASSPYRVAPIRRCEIQSVSFKVAPLHLHQLTSGYSLQEEHNTLYGAGEVA